MLWAVCSWQCLLIFVSEVSKCLSSTLLCITLQAKIGVNQYLELGPIVASCVKKMEAYELCRVNQQLETSENIFIFNRTSENTCASQPILEPTRPAKHPKTTPVSTESHAFCYIKVSNDPKVYQQFPVHQMVPLIIHIDVYISLQAMGTGCLTDSLSWGILRRCNAPPLVAFEGFNSTNGNDTGWIWPVNIWRLNRNDYEYAHQWCWNALGVFATVRTRNAVVCSFCSFCKNLLHSFFHMRWPSPTQHAPVWVQRES